jgi:hypothetical protein
VNKEGLLQLMSKAMQQGCTKILEKNGKRAMKEKERGN